MGIDILRFNNTPDEIAAALLLRSTHNIQVKCLPEQTGELTNAGFFEVPESIVCFVGASSFHDGKFRLSKNLKKSIDFWSQSNLEISVTNVKIFGLDRVVQEIYYPIFVPYFYTRGISPYGSHNLDTFRKFLHEDMYLVLISRGDVLIGAALLQHQKNAMNYNVIKGHLDSDEYLEGLIVAIKDEYRKAYRAFIYYLVLSLEHIGFKTLSLGSDLSVVGPQYCKVLIEKLKIASAVAIPLRRYRYYNFWNKKNIYSGWFFLKKNSTSIDLVPLGEDTNNINQIRRLLSL